MPNNFKPPTKGQTIAEFLEKQSLWQIIHDALDRVTKLEQKIKNIQAPTLKLDKPNPVLPWAINRTGEDLGNAFSIVAYDEPFVDPDVPVTIYAPRFAMDTTYFAKVPDGLCRWGVFNTPIIENGLAPITVQGIAHVQIDVLDESHTMAKEIVGDVTKLRSSLDGTSSSARILWKESGLGLKWASILLGQCDGIYHYLFTLQTVMGHSLPNMAIASIKDMDNLVVIKTDLVRDPQVIFADLAAGDRGICILQNEKFYIIQAYRDCD